MLLFWWRRRSNHQDPSGSVEELRHDIRNAIMGIQLERKVIGQSLLKIGQHQQRIEEALKCR